MKTYLPFLLFLFITIIQLQAATIRYVKENGVGNGSSWSNASNSIQAMIDASASGDEVWIAKGTYYPITETIARDSRTRTFLLKDGINLYGGFEGNELSIKERILSDINNDGVIDPFEYLNKTILSGDIDGSPDSWVKKYNLDDNTWQWSISGNENNVYRVVTCVSGFSVSAVFDGFIISGGNANGTSSYYNLGGGILALCNITVSNCTFFNCYAIDGGAIFSVPYTSLTESGGVIPPTSKNYITNCKIYDCHAVSGGAIFSDNGSPEISYCNISNCSSSNCGGGIFIASANSTGLVNNCFVSDCSSALYGGGIYSRSSCTGYVSIIQYSYIYLRNNHIINCNSQYGGGICSENSGPPSDYSNTHSYILGCFVTNCSSYYRGGAYILLTIMRILITIHMSNIVP